MFRSAVCNSLAHDGAGIVQSPCHRQNFKIALGQIAERVEIIHLTFDGEKGAHRVVIRS